MSNLPAQILVEPLTGPFDATGAAAPFVPGSKSLTNRALMLAAVAKGTSTLKGVLFSDDSRRMLEALAALGYKLEIGEAARTVVVHGADGRMHSAAKNSPTELFLGNAGTATRFLTAGVCLAETGREFVITGIARMLERPIGELVEPLRELGADIAYLGEEGFPPVKVTGAGSLAGGRLRMKPTLSSQFISALLQIGPLCEGGLAIAFDGPVTSLPYVKMTVELMRLFGAKVETDADYREIRVQAGGYVGRELLIEPDASNASYAMGLAAVMPGAATEIVGLSADSLQGDAAFAHELELMGANVVYGQNSITVRGGKKLNGIDRDFNAIPDMVQTAAVVALFADGPTRFRNVGNLRVKETDRMEALRVELSKLGATVTVMGDDLVVEPYGNGVLVNRAVGSDSAGYGEPLSKENPVVIQTYDDHRMAMSFTVAGLKHPGVIIDDPTCVNKTFPSFFQEIQTLRGTQRQNQV